MPAPAPIPPLAAVAWNPRLIPKDVRQGGSGGGVGGLTPNPIRGISIAFGDNPSTETPRWQNILNMGNPP